jgi:hypothetical protein
MTTSTKLEQYISSIVPAEFLIPKSYSITDISNSILSSSSIVSQKGLNSSENIILKTIILILIRNNVDCPIELYILIGLKDLEEQDIKTLSTETTHTEHIAQTLLEQTNEEIPLNRVNMALSNIIDKLPSDIKEQIPPYKKQEISNLLLLVQETVPTKPTKEKFNSVFSNYNQPIYNPSGILNPLNSITLNDIAQYQLQQEILQTAKNNQSQPILPYLLAEYVDISPTIYIGNDNKAYILDTSSNTIHYLPSNLQTINSKQLTDLLTSYNIDPNNILQIVNYMTSSGISKLSLPDVQSENILYQSKLPQEEILQTIPPLSSITTPSTTDTTPNPTTTTAPSNMSLNQILNIIKVYQNQYSTTNTIVSGILTLILILIISYIIYKILIPNDNTNLGKQIMTSDNIPSTNMMK